LIRGHSRRSRGDIGLNLGRLRDQVAQHLGCVFEQGGSDRTFAIDETTQSPFIDTAAATPQLPPRQTPEHNGRTDLADPAVKAASSQRPLSVKWAMNKHRLDAQPPCARQPLGDKDL
jgi:hypothetical protein